MTLEKCNDDLRKWIYEKKKNMLTGHDEPELQKRKLFKTTLRKMFYLTIINKHHHNFDSVYKILNLCLPEIAFSVVLKMFTRVQDLFKSTANNFSFIAD